MKIYVFGSSLTSCYWNGAATYYRGIYKNLHQLGHRITFAEPDIYNRQQNRDCPLIEYATVRVYETPRDRDKVLWEACQSDLIIKHSGVGADDELLEAVVLQCRTSSSRTRTAFWDVDAPATLARVEENSQDPFRKLIPRYDFIFTYGGGDPVIQHYLNLGAQHCFPIYNGLDPDTHHPAFPDEKFKCSARMVMNINRESMAKVGFSPPTRVFEAAGAGACVITDAWAGIDEFFQPGQEIVVASSAEAVAHYLREIGREDSGAIGTAMRKRALRDHSYRLRAQQVDQVLRIGGTNAPDLRATQYVGTLLAEERN